MIIIDTFRHRTVVERRDDSQPDSPVRAWKGGAGMNANEEFMRVGDVREYLKISRSLAYSLCDGSKIPVYRIGRVILTTKAEVDQYVMDSTSKEIM